MSLRSRAIHLASTLPERSRERKALLEVLATTVKFPDVPQVPSANTSGLSENMRNYLRGALTHYPGNIRTSGNVSQSLVKKGLMEGPVWEDLGSTGYGADFYKLTPAGFAVAKVVVREALIADMEAKVTQFEQSGKSPERILKVLERMSQGPIKDLKKRL